MLDSGGYSILNGSKSPKKLQNKLREYVEFLNRYVELLDWYLILDLPCTCHEDSYWRIRRTVENACYIVDNVVDPRKAVIVVQGYEPQDYATCCKLYKERGLITARVAIGSLKRYKYSYNSIRKISCILSIVRKIISHNNNQDFCLDHLRS